MHLVALTIAEFAQGAALWLLGLILLSQVRLRHR